VEGTSCATFETRPIEKDAGTIDHAGLDASVLLFNGPALFLGNLLVLPMLGFEALNRLYNCLLVFVINEMGSETAATL
jgi:hypothetical protein